MNGKVILVAIGIAAVILAVAILPIKPGDVPPAIIEGPGVEERSEVGIESGTGDITDVEERSMFEIESGARDITNIEERSSFGVGTDSPQINESATIQLEEGVEYLVDENGAKYYIDENGTKHYILDAKDTPSMKER